MPPILPFFLNPVRDHRMVGPPKRGNHGNGPPSSIYRRREIGSWLTAPCQKTPTPFGSISPLNVYDEVLCMTLSHNDLVAFPRLLITFLTFFFFTSRPETPNNHVITIRVWHVSYGRSWVAVCSFRRGSAIGTFMAVACAARLKNRRGNSVID